MAPQEGADRASLPHKHAESSTSAAEQLDSTSEQQAPANTALERKASVGSSVGAGRVSEDGKFLVRRLSTRAKDAAGAIGRKFKVKRRARGTDIPRSDAQVDEEADEVKESEDEGTMPASSTVRPRRRIQRDPHPAPQWAGGTKDVPPRPLPEQDDGSGQWVSGEDAHRIPPNRRAAVVRTRSDSVDSWWASGSD